MKIILSLLFIVSLVPCKSNGQTPGQMIMLGDVVQNVRQDSNLYYRKTISRNALMYYFRTEDGDSFEILLSDGKIIPDTNVIVTIYLPKWFQKNKRTRLQETFSLIFDHQKKILGAVYTKEGKGHFVDYRQYPTYIDRIWKNISRLQRE